ncbi:MAG: hypothetical protein HQL08_00845 [Nitrospirae bacterium]|nr:hypothetical protein [Nitrospirota bacterium]
MMRHRSRNEKGFLILEVMVASLILTAGVAATMYLFRLGFQHLERANDNNLFSSKLPQVVNYMKVLDMEAKQGTEDMGDDVIMHWDARLVDTVRPSRDTPDGKLMHYFNLNLYKVTIRLDSRKLSREYEMNVFRSAKVDKNISPLEF